MSPEPYYQDEQATIYCGDCREILQSMQPTDIVVSSPPYNTIAATTPSGMMKEWRHKQNDGYDGYKMQKCTSSLSQLEKDTTTTWTKLSIRNGCSLLIQTNPRLISMHRPNTITLNAKRFAPSHEFIYGFGTPHFWDDSLNTLMTVWKIMPERDIKGHPSA